VVGGLLLAAAFLLAARPAAANPLTKPEILKLVRKNVQERRLVAVVRELGIDFKITPEVVGELRGAGASPSLITALQGVGGTEPPEPAPTASAAPATPPVAPPVSLPAPEPAKSPAPPTDQAQLEPPAAKPPAPLSRHRPILGLPSRR
jgi:hypothetical protein